MSGQGGFYPNFQSSELSLSSTLSSLETKIQYFDHLVKQSQSLTQISKGMEIIFQDGLSLIEESSSTFQQQQAIEEIIFLLNERRYNNLDLIKAVKGVSILCSTHSNIKITQILDINEKENNHTQKKESILDDEQQQKIEKEVHEAKQKLEEKKEKERILNEEKIKEEEEKKQKKLLLQRKLESLCCVCLEQINKHFAYESSLQYFQKCPEEELFFESQCGHFFSSICMAQDYFRCFQSSKVKNKVEFFSKLKNRLNPQSAQNSKNFNPPTQPKDQQKQMQQNERCFTCNICEDKAFPELEKINSHLSNWITEIRKSRRTFECEICCLDELDLEEEGIALTNCDHIFCYDCLSSHLIMKVNSNKFHYQDMICPHDGCKELVNNFIVDNMLNTPNNQLVFNRMIKMQLMDLHLSEKNIKVAQCPGFQIKHKETSEIKDLDDNTITLIRLGSQSGIQDCYDLQPCQVIFTFDQKKNKIFKCSVCSYTSCLKGCEDNHIKSTRGKDCSSFQKWKAKNLNQLDIVSALDPNTFCQCPNCKNIIIRSGGCNHITCTMPNCGMEFCFKCQSKWVCWRHLHYF